MKSQNTTNQIPSVSVIITAYNIEQYIERAINSVIAQTYAADEIIVIDDGSTDGTAEKIKRYGNKIKYIYQPNAGVSTARNTAIRAAQSTWIAFLDGDDEWLNDNLQQQIQLLKQNPNLNWSSANYIRCLCDEKQQKPAIEPTQINKLLHSKNYFDDYINAHTNGITGCTDTMIIKRKTLIDAGLFTKDLYRAEDMDMWFRIAFRSPAIGYIAAPLAIYHMNTPQSLSTQKAAISDYCDLISRLIEIAKTQKRYGTFKPCAAKLLRGWMRSMLFNQRAADIRQILNQFDDLFGPGYKALMKILTTFPKLTATALRLISAITRKLKIRKQLVRKPR